MKNLSPIQLLIINESLLTLLGDGHWVNKEHEQEADDLIKKLKQEMESKGLTQEMSSNLFDEDNGHWQYH